MIKEAFPVFIGYDSREADAARVCAASLFGHASMPLHVRMLREPALRHVGLYTRRWYLSEGRRHDAIDRKPFSTNFSFSRFLVPSLMQHDGWALFIDCDFLFLADIAELIALADPRYAVQVVKHGPLTGHGVKMDGQAQQPYFRKNWSSAMLINCGHASNQRLTPAAVNSETGQWLHSFSWLDDDEIGALPHAWNWLSGVDAPLASGDPKAVHFTLGVPSMPGREAAPYAEHWKSALSRL
jgi:hypothetical protein